jgi:hypothetical protein
MTAAGRDCALILSAGNTRVSIPFSEETLRNRYRLIEEEPTLESDGRRGNRSEEAGAEGCFVTRLTISVVPLLFALAFGKEAGPVLVSETRSLWRHELSLDYRAAGVEFDAVSDRVFRIRLLRELRPLGWELRVQCGEAIYLKLDAEGDIPIEEGSPGLLTPLQDEECFRESGTRLSVNGTIVESTYGAYITVMRGSSCRTEIHLHRKARYEDAHLFQQRIEKLELDARLYRDEYEERHKGRFVIRVTDLVLLSEDAKPDSASEIVGPLRYIVAGELCAEVYTQDGGRLLP